MNLFFEISVKIIRAVKGLIVLSTYMIAWFLEPLYPNNHPFKDNFPTFEEWVDKATPLNVSFGIFFTGSFYILLSFAFETS